MHVVQFSLYYLNLRLMALLHMTNTTLPLDMSWRYNYWQRRIRFQNRR